MVLPPPPPATAPPPATPTATATATAPAVRHCYRAGRCGNRSGQCGDADGGSDRRSHRADAPKHRNRHSCDGLGQRCQNPISHSAHPSFLSSHLHFQAGGMRDLRVDPAATNNIAAECIPYAFSRAFSLGKDLTSALQAHRALNLPITQTKHTHGSLSCQGQDRFGRARFP